MGHSMQSKAAANVMIHAIYTVSMQSKAAANVMIHAIYTVSMQSLFYYAEVNNSGILKSCLAEQTISDLLVTKLPGGMTCDYETPPSTIKLS